MYEMETGPNLASSNPNPVSVLTGRISSYIIDIIQQKTVQMKINYNVGIYSTKGPAFVAL